MPFTEQDTDMLRVGNISREIIETPEAAEPPLGASLFVPDLPLQNIVVWEDNPRKVFDDEALLELTKSIAADGVQQRQFEDRHKETHRPQGFGWCAAVKLLFDRAGHPMENRPPDPDLDPEEVAAVRAAVAQSMAASENFMRGGD